MSVRFVAEVSSNHARDFFRALAFVDVAAELGCDAVKFQQFKIRELFAPEALAHRPELLERERWELPEGFNRDLALQANALGIAYSCTPFYRDAVGVLEPWVDFYKLASYQVLWLDLLREVGRTGKPVVLATGMATLDETRAAAETLLEAGTPELTLLHCVSLYPTPPELANLRAIETLRAELDLPVGWSDHSVSPAVVERAVRRWGATLVEFHLDLEGEGEEYDGGHCWLPETVRPVIEATRRYEAAGEPRPEGTPSDALPMDGDGAKEPRPEEALERSWRTDPADGRRPLMDRRARLAEEAA